MSDENDKTNEGQGNGTPAGTPSTTGPRAPLSLKPRAAGSVSTGTVRQSFSHGRTKTVVVETKRRPGAPVGGHQRPQGFDVARPRADAPAPQAQAQTPRPAAPNSGMNRAQPAGGSLSGEEQEARRRAIETATQAQAERAAAAAAEQARRDAAAREQARGRRCTDGLRVRTVHVSDAGHGARRARGTALSVGRESTPSAW